MKSIGALIVCGLIAHIASARPVVIEDTAVLTRPDASWQYFGRFGVAIDGDYALVSGERYVPDVAAPSGQRHEAAAFIYRRASTSSWTYVSRLGPIATIGNLKPGLAMKDGVVITITDRYRIWERSGDTWVLQPVAGIAPGTLNGPDIEIDGGRILAHCAGCTYSFAVLSKVNTTWLLENGALQPGEHGVDSHAASLDLQGNRVLMGDEARFGGYAVRAFRRDSSGWQPDMGINAGTADPPRPPLALSGEHYAFAQHRRFGTMVIENHNGSQNYAGSRFRPADLAMQPDTRSATAMERVGELIAQRNFRYDTAGYTYHLFRINEDAEHTQSLVAMLQPRDGVFLGNLLDATSGRVIVSGWGEGVGDNNVRIFELPALEAPPVEVHDFEPPVSAAAWQPTAGSAFSVVRIGYTYMYRQASTAGTPGSFLQTSTGNQAIEADVTLRAFEGADRWIGLATRRSDDANYYYVTFRTSGSIELKRMQDGVFTTIAAAPATLLTGRAYKLRLESIGGLHRVYLDNRLVLSARDRALSEGAAGILMNRAAADWDNVTITPNPFTTILVDDFSASNDRWSVNAGTLQNGYFTMPQLSFRNEGVAGVRTEDQVVRARIRPVSFTSPQDWVGIAGRYSDHRNNVYVSLYGRNVISLWQRTNGAITQLATQRLTVTPGTWYDVRLEMVAGSNRVYVDGQLVLMSNADLGPLAPSLTAGGVAIMASQASADFDDFIAYRP